MMRSLFSGVAGLRTHQVRMDVIGNNIANVNTAAYKSSSMTFNDLMYQTTQHASRATERTGGVNARQIGLGSKSGAISTTVETQGATETTNNPFDMRITGKAFYIVNDGTSQMYTRDGSFYVDGAGNLAMQSTGYFVYGWTAIEDETTGKISVNTNGGIGKLQIMSPANQTYPPEGTTQGVVNGNIDAHDTNITSDMGKTVTLEFYDNLGYLYTAKFSVRDVNGDVTTSTDANGNPVYENGELVEHTYTMTLEDILDSNGNSIGAEKLSYVTFSDQVGYTTRQYNEETKTADSTDPPTGNPLPINDNYNMKITDSTIEFTGKQGTAAEGKTFTMTRNGYVSDVNDATSTKELFQEVYGYTPEINYTDADGNPQTKPAYYDQDETRYPNRGYENLTYIVLDDGSLQVNTNNYVTMTFDAKTGKITSPTGKLVLDFQQNAIIREGEDANLLHQPKMAGFTDVNIDFSTITNYNTNGTSTIGAVKGDLESLNTGRSVGEMNGITVGKDGTIYATYSNGQTKLLGQIATAEFANASGLEKEGDNLYKSTLNSGEAVIQDVTMDGGYITTGVLEMSNVDLSGEFTTMITTQRGFQANSRIITVSDTLLEELTNLKR